MSIPESEILFPSGKTIEIAGEKLVITRMKLFQIIKGTGLLGGVFDLMFLMFKDKNLNNTSAIFKMFEKDGDNLLEFISLAIGKNRKFVNELDLDEAIELLISIIEVNADFFVSKVMPMMYERTEDLELFKSMTSKINTPT